MKSIKVKILFLSTSILLVLSSCTIQKRTHRSGYYIDWHKKSTNNVVNENTEAKANLVVSTKNEIILPQKEDINFNKQTPVVCGDTLYLKSGEIFLCQVIEITAAEIKYRKCDNINGPLLLVSSNSVLKIKYINGVTELVNSSSAENINQINLENKLNSCGDTLIFQDGRVLACKITEERADYIKYKKCDNSKAEYYAERIKLKQIKKSTDIVKAQPIIDNPKLSKPKKRRVNLFALFAFFFSLTSCFVFLFGISIFSSAFILHSLVLYLITIILATIGIVQINNNEEYFGSAFSILAFIMPLLTLAFVFFILLLLIG